MKPKSQLLINGKGKVEVEKLKKSKAFIDYSQAIGDVYEKLEEYNLTNIRKVLQ